MDRLRNVDRLLGEGDRLARPALFRRDRSQEAEDGRARIAFLAEGSLGDRKRLPQAPLGLGRLAPGLGPARLVPVELQDHAFFRREAPLKSGQELAAHSTRHADERLWSFAVSPGRAPAQRDIPGEVTSRVRIRDGVGSADVVSGPKE